MCQVLPNGIRLSSQIMLVRPAKVSKVMKVVVVNFVYLLSVQSPTKVLQQ